MDEHIFMDSNNPIWDKQQDPDYYELYGNLRKQIEQLAELTETLAESTENGSVILINYKLQHIINNQ